MAHGAHSERKHSKWNSSGAHRWTICYGQPNKCENLPEPPPSKYNLEGTAAHEILELCVDAFTKQTPFEPSRFTNSPSTIQSVAIVMDYLTKLRVDYPDLIVEGEKRVWFPQDRVPKEDCGGTSDILAYSLSAQRAWVIDFKHGEGVPVEVVGNEQLLSYACARLFTRDLLITLPVSEVMLVVIQPRCRHRLGPVRDWTVSVVELLNFVSDIDDALAIGSRPDAPLVGGDHCRWCPAVHDCEARDKHALQGMQQDFAHVKDLDIWAPPPANTMPIAKMLIIMEHKAQIVQWLNAIEARLIAAAVHEAVETPGWKVVEAQSRRHFLENGQHVANELIGLSGGRLGIDDVFPRKLMTITDAETRLVQFATADAAQGWKEQAAKAMRDRIALLTDSKSSGNLTLARDTDSRPSTSKVAQQFGHVVGALDPPQPVPALTYGALAAPIVDPQTLIRND